MSLVTWHPTSTMETFFDTNPLFLAQENTCQAGGGTYLPKVNVIENKDAFRLEAETPGMEVKDINIEVHNGVLTIKGRKEDNRETQKENYHIQEFSTQSFERNFKLSDRVNTEKVSAKIENGVLKVDLPIHEQVKPQRIEVVGVS